MLEPGTWGTWGGAIDPGQEPLESALREAAAETGHPVSGTDAMLLLVYRDEKAGFSYHTFLVTEDREFEPSLNWESDDAAWFGHGDWPSPLHPGLAALLADPLASGKLAAAVAAVSRSRRQADDGHQPHGGNLQVLTPQCQAHRLLPYPE